VISILVIPEILDFLFFGQLLARYARIVIFLTISFTLLINNKIFISSKLIGTGTIVLTIFIWAIGTISSINHGGVLTPNFALLTLLMFISSANSDLQKYILRTASTSTHILIVLSAVVILLKYNPRNYGSPSEGYPVFFDFIGIPGRNVGIFTHPNTLGQVASLSFLLMILFKLKRFYLIFPLICLLKCGSRTSLIATAFGLLCIVLFSALRRNQKIKNSEIKGSVPIIALLIFGLLLSAVYQFFSLIIFLNPGGLTDRVAIWQESLLIFKESQIFGLGWGWEKRAIQSQLLKTWAVSAHNFILEILFSVGILGTVCFLIILARGLSYFYKMNLEEKVILSMILVLGLSESVVDIQYPTLATYIYFVIIVGASREISEEYA